jgi:hypothetical protein
MRLVHERVYDSSIFGMNHPRHGSSWSAYLPQEPFVAVRVTHAPRRCRRRRRRRSSHRRGCSLV